MFYSNSERASERRLTTPCHQLRLLALARARAHGLDTQAFPRALTLPSAPARSEAATGTVMMMRKT
jgi:hypothetical protein